MFVSDQCAASAGANVRAYKCMLKKRGKEMGVEYRMFCVVAAENANRQRHESFIKGLKAPDGWAKKVEDDAVPPGEQASDYRYIDSDFRIMTRKKTGETLIWCNTPGTSIRGFAHKDCYDEAKSIIGSHTTFQLEATDAIAIIRAGRKAIPPWAWVKTVIDKHYDEGLRFFAVMYGIDQGNGAMFCHSEATAADTDRLEGSQHCIAFSLDQDDWETELNKAALERVRSLCKQAPEGNSITRDGSGNANKPQEDGIGIGEDLRLQSPEP